MSVQTSTKVRTAVVGSYPKPRYVYAENGRSLLDSFGFSFVRRQNEVGSAEFVKLLDKAAAQAIKDQDRAGIDLVTDGEERRGHYVTHILKELGGIDTKHLKTIPFRGGTDTQHVPRVVGEITHRQPIALDEFLFTKHHTKGVAKVGLPGPTTFTDSVADEYYGDRKTLAFAYAAAIQHEVAALIKAGCQVIQFDDPVLLRHPKDAKAWGLQALERCFEGLEHKATFIVHICRGYPNKPFEKQGIAYKANAAYYRDILAWLAKSKIDIVSIEGVQDNLDLSVLSAIGGKTVMLGVLDVGDNKVESIESLVGRGQEALHYIQKGQLILAPDCGMVELTRTSAKQKLANMCQAAQELNQNPS